MKRTVGEYLFRLTGQVEGSPDGGANGAGAGGVELPSTGKSSTTGYALSIAVSSFSQRMTEKGLSRLQDR